MNEYVIGADPGKEGCLVVLHRNKSIRVFRFMKMKDPDFKMLFLNFIPTLNVIRCGMERTSLRPGERHGGRAERNCGRLEGMFILSCGFTYVESKTWQYHHGLGGKQGPDTCKHEQWLACCESCEYNARKRNHKKKAQELRPDLKVTEDMADGILIADYVWHLVWGIPNEILSEATVRRGTGVVRITEPRVLS